MITWPAKGPGETEDFTFDFSALLQAGETIDTYTLDATGVTVDSDSKTGGIITASLSGGTAGVPASVVATIQTDAVPPRTYVETAILPIGEEPVTLAQAKDYLRVKTATEDAKILAMIPRARKWVEDYTGLALMRRTFTERLRPTMGGVIRLSKGPLVSVPDVEYVDSSGSTATVSPTAYPPATAIFATWPSLDQNEAFSVTYTAGLALQEIDERLIGAMLALIESEYSEGFAYPQRGADAAEQCCGYLRVPVL